MRILVTGATGKVGTAVMEQLTKAGLPTVAAVRSVERAMSQLPQERNTAFVPFDFSAPTTFSKALEDVSHLFLVLPPGLEEATAALQLINQAEARNIAHITLLSGRTTGNLRGRPLNQIEQTLAHGRVPYTILRAGWFMQNFNTWVADEIREQHKFHLPAGDSKTAFVDVRDIAEAVQQAITNPQHAYQRYELVSEEALDHYQIASTFTKVLGRPINYVDVQAPDYIELMLKKGWSISDAAFNVFLYDMVKTGKESTIAPDLKQMIGREPLTFEQYVRDHKWAWMPPEENK